MILVVVAVVTLSGCSEVAVSAAVGRVNDSPDRVPFAEMRCDALTRRFDIRLSLSEGKNEKPADIDAVKPRCDGDIVTTTSGLFVTVRIG